MAPHREAAGLHKDGWENAVNGLGVTAWTARLLRSEGGEHREAGRSRFGRTSDGKRKKRQAYSSVKKDASATTRYRS